MNSQISDNILCLFLIATSFLVNKGEYITASPETRERVYVFVHLFVTHL